MVEVFYIRRLNPLESTKLKTVDLDKLWADVEPFRPIPATIYVSTSAYIS